MRIELRILNAETVTCPAVNAVAVWRVFSLDRYAREEPEAAVEVPTEDERGVIGIDVRGEPLLSPAERDRPSPMDIWSWVVLLSRIASQQVPLPGNAVLRRASLQLQTMARVTQAAKARPPYPNLRLCQM